MRNVLLYAPALVCAGSILVCVRMMRRGHGTDTRDQRHERTAEPRDDERAT
jgi:hypothetical protein